MLYLIAITTNKFNTSLRDVSVVTLYSHQLKSLSFSINFPSPRRSTSTHTCSDWFLFNPIPRQGQQTTILLYRTTHSQHKHSNLTSHTNTPETLLLRRPRITKYFHPRRALSWLSTTGNSTGFAFTHFPLGLQTHQLAYRR